MFEKIDGNYIQIVWKLFDIAETFHVDSTLAEKFLKNVLTLEFVYVVLTIKKIYIY